MYHWWIIWQMEAADQIRYLPLEELWKWAYTWPEKLWED